MTKNRKLKQTARIHAAKSGLAYRHARAEVLETIVDTDPKNFPYSVLLGHIFDTREIGWAPSRVSSLAVSADTPSTRRGVTSSIVQQLKESGAFVAFHRIPEELNVESIEAGLYDFTKLAKRTMAVRAEEGNEADMLGIPDRDFAYQNLDDRDLYVVVDFGEGITSDGAEMMRSKLSTVIDNGGAFGVHVVLVAESDNVFGLLDEDSDTLRVKTEGDSGAFAVDLGSDDPGSFELELSDERAVSSHRVDAMA